MFTLTTLTFTAPITGKAKQKNADGYAVTFDWKLPGSQFDFTLYGRDWGEVAAWDHGTVPDVVIARGNIKSGKSGEYSTDYFWNLQSITEGTGRPTPAAQPQSNGYQPQGQGEFRRSKEEMRLLDCLKAAATWGSPIGSPHQVWAQAEAWYKEVTEWEANRLSNTAEIEPKYHPDGSELPVEAAEAAEGAAPTQRPDPAKMVTDSVAQWNLDNPKMKLTRDYIQNAMTRLYQIGEPTCKEALQMLTPEQGLELSTLIAKGELPDRLAALAVTGEGDDVDNLPF